MTREVEISIKCTISAELVGYYELILSRDCLKCCINGSTALTPEPPKLLETTVPLAEPEEVDQIEEEEKPEGAWAQEWIIMAHRLVNAGLTLSLPVPEGEKYFAPLPDILPFAPFVASLYR